MTKKEAYDILGLQEGASEKEVLERYYDLLRTQMVTGSGPEAEQIMPKVRFPNPDAALPLPKDELNN